MSRSTRGRRPSFRDRSGQAGEKGVWPGRLRTKGIPAAGMPSQVPAHVARERSRILRALADKKKLAFMRRFVGMTVGAITLRSCGAGTHAREASGTNDCQRGIPEAVGAITEALTDNYLKLHLKGHHEPNRWLRAIVEQVEDGALVASRESDRESPRDSALLAD